MSLAEEGSRREILGGRGVWALNYIAVASLAWNPSSVHQALRDGVGIDLSLRLCTCALYECMLWKLRLLPTCKQAAAIATASSQAAPISR